MTTEIFRDFFLGEIIITVTFFLHLEGHFESLSLISFVVCVDCLKMEIFLFFRVMRLIRGSLSTVS